MRNADKKLVAGSEAFTGLRHVASEADTSHAAGNIQQNHSDTCTRSARQNAVLKSAEENHRRRRTQVALDSADGSKKGHTT